MNGSPYDRVKQEDITCENITMVPGDRLYLPFGVLHRAVTGEGGSVHLSVQFVKEGVTWSDLILKSLGWINAEMFARCSH
jgi:ribosomal protein L16 Arg81 hydroxylase